MYKPTNASRNMKQEMARSFCEDLEHEAKKEAAIIESKEAEFTEADIAQYGIDFINLLSEHDIDRTALDLIPNKAYSETTIGLEALKVSMETVNGTITDQKISCFMKGVKFIENRSKI